ncbi:hypothetical protein [Rudaea sp.]|uniref:hypothetical protein n=1 Tax=Rudaea sp. TaxID=2136325 RepID=UPI00321FA19F
MFVIVSTIHFLLLVDLTTRSVVPLESHRPGYYGISWHAHSEDLVLSHDRAGHITFADIASYAGSEVGAVSCGQRTTPGFLSAPHQILCASDGRIVCTNTGRNAVAIFDFDQPGRIQELRLSDARWDRFNADGMDGDHLNSVFEKDGRLYVLAHRFTKGSKLGVFAYPSLEPIEVRAIDGRTGLHNIWIDDGGEAISCHSEAGGLVELGTNRMLWESGGAVYTRGLAASRDFVLVGESERAPRDQRGNSQSGLWMLDRRTWQTMDYFPLGPYGQVHEVRLLNVEDHAHHRHTFAGLAGLRARDLRLAIAAEKIGASARARDSRLFWQGFENQYGALVAGENGARIADHRNLCLITRPAAKAEEAQLEFRYELEAGHGESHVAAVAYRGNGADTDMHALLIHPIDGQRAAIRLWVHAHGEWSIEQTFDSGDLPLAGVIRLRAGAEQIELFVDDTPVVALPVAQFPWGQGRLGIRWLGATIRPGHARAA